MRIKQAKTERKGFIAVVVLCMIILLHVLVLGFNYKSRANISSANSFLKSEKALNCARAGLNIAIASIAANSDSHTRNNVTDLLSQETVFPIGDGQCSLAISEENGKFNLNMLRDASGRLNQTRIGQLLQLIKLLNRKNSGQARISYDLVPSIIDWTDNDEQVTYLPFVKHNNPGAESSYYSSLKPPYTCKNASLETIEELLLVKGVKQDIFDLIYDYVTVKGDGKVNINSASKLVIQSLLEEKDPSVAEMIIERRQLKPFENITELRDLPLVTDSIYQTIKKTATVSHPDQYYRVTSQGIVDNFTCKIVAVLRKNVKTKNIDVILYKEV
ncbi:MAG: general secretion pathway protein GspK [Sedimentisphaerales bacterium]|nr:general secretion pathway protein GspK [Sedimentisphaerales bacterium]